MSKKNRAKKRHRRQEKWRARVQQVAIADLDQLGRNYPSGDSVVKDRVNDQIFANTSQANLFFALTNLASRVSDHIARMDRGVYYAADDLAVALRGLLRRGAGTGLLLQAVEEFRVDMPLILCSRPPSSDAHLGVGLVPVLEILEGHDVGAEDSRFVVGPMDSWLTGPAIIYVTDAGEVQTRSWHDFVGHYANKFSGAHLDKMPEYMGRLDWCGAGGLSLSNYLLRTLGVMAFDLAQEVLTGIAKSLGVEVLANHVFGGPGWRGEFPSMRNELGMLLSFHESDELMAFDWHVDERSDNNRLRLYFNNAVWDYKWTPQDGLTVDKFLQPVSEYLFQSPRLPIYPDQQVGGLHVSPMYVHLPRVRTLGELRTGTPLSFPEDFHPNAPAPGWQFDPPLRPGVVSTRGRLAAYLEENAGDDWLGDAPEVSVANLLRFTSTESGDALLIDRRDALNYVVPKQQQGETNRTGPDQADDSPSP